MRVKVLVYLIGSFGSRFHKTRFVHLSCHLVGGTFFESLERSVLGFNVLQRLRNAFTIRLEISSVLSLQNDEYSKTCKMIITLAVKLFACSESVSNLWITRT